MCFLKMKFYHCSNFFTIVFNNSFSKRLTCWKKEWRQNCFFVVVVVVADNKLKRERERDGDINLAVFELWHRRRNKGEGGQQKKSLLVFSRQKFNAWERWRSSPSFVVSLTHISSCSRVVWAAKTFSANNNNNNNKSKNTKRKTFAFFFFFAAQV